MSHLTLVIFGMHFSANLLTTTEKQKQNREKKTANNTINLRPVFHRLPEPNRVWLLVVYFSR